MVYRLNPTNITINIPKPQSDNILYIVVENMGRLNYGDDMLDAKVSILQIDKNQNFLNKSLIIIFKGIISDVTLDGKVVKNWRMCLTDGFIPNYRKNLGDPGFVSLISQFMKPENLLSVKLSKYEIKIIVSIL